MPCPYHYAVDLLSSLDAEFPGHGPDAPLFPTRTGKVPTKGAVVAAITELVLITGIWLTAQAKAIAGHVLRVTGARFLTRHGLDILSVQLLGRWGSNVIAQYIGEVPVEELARKFRRAQGAQSREVSSDRMTLMRLESETAGTSRGDLAVNVLSGHTHRLVQGLGIARCGWAFQGSKWGVLAKKRCPVTCVRCARGYQEESDEE